jgi:hypothetical protein
MVRELLWMSMKIISRRTVTWFAIAVMSIAYLTYRALEFQPTCRNYVRVHPYRANPSKPKRKPDDTVLVNFDTCSYEDPAPVDEAVVTLIAVVSAPVFLGPLFQDSFRWRRRKRAVNAA